MFFKFSTNPKKRSGFTIIELMIVMFIIVTLSTLMIALSVDLTSDHQLSEETRMLKSTIRLAQIKAINNYHDSPYGIKILDDRYILFQGDSFEDRDQNFDIIYKIDSDLALADGQDEVVFSKYTGRPKTK